MASLSDFCQWNGIPALSLWDVKFARREADNTEVLRAAPRFRPNFAHLVPEHLSELLLAQSPYSDFANRRALAMEAHGRPSQKSSMEMDGM